MKRTPRPGRLAAKLNQIKVDVHIVITFSKSAPRGEKGLQTTEVFYSVPLLVYNISGSHSLHLEIWLFTRKFGILYNL